MRDTRLPLSVGFFDQDGFLFAVEDMQPETDTEHRSGRPTKFALELAQGDFARKGLAIGDRLVDRDCRPAN